MISSNINILTTLCKELIFKKAVVGGGDRILNMANLINTAINTFTNASIDSLVNGTIDTGRYLRNLRFYKLIF